VQHAPRLPQQHPAAAARQSACRAAKTSQRPTPGWMSPLSALSKMCSTCCPQRSSPVIAVEMTSFQHAGGHHNAVTSICIADTAELGVGDRDASAVYGMDTRTNIQPGMAARSELGSSHERCITLITLPAPQQNNSALSHMCTESISVQHAHRQRTCRIYLVCAEWPVWKGKAP
jgi:hypothetical protein